MGDALRYIAPDHPAVEVTSQSYTAGPSWHPPKVCYGCSVGGWLVSSERRTFCMRCGASWVRWAEVLPAG